MPAIVVLGLQWGDEGKGKIIDLLAERVHAVARYQGGSNAGHTVVVDGKEIVLHLVPCGVFYPGVACVIGNGLVVDPQALLSEMELVERHQLSVRDRLLVSEQAHVILPYHKLLDEAREKKQSDSIGTTHRGIGPAYTDKVARTGIRMGDLLDEKVLRKKIHVNLEEKNFLFQQYYHVSPLEEEPLFQEYAEYGRRLKPFITNTGSWLNRALKEGKTVLCEGGQGTLLDVDYGTYPYVTSSNATSGGACTGLGIPPTSVSQCFGVAKAYTTRVGHGPFPTELHEEGENHLRTRGREFGATTGRPRRCGWLDLPALRWAVQVNGVKDILMTKMDVLDQEETIPVCVAYEHEGAKLSEFPSSIRVLEECHPVYEHLPGWKTSTAGARTFEDLPPQAQQYVKYVEDQLEASVTMISVGAQRHETIVREAKEANKAR